jgi:NAD(P)-dependent dehydrogenase (short-subunit alcohol dehydrogenase family)
VRDTISTLQSKESGVDIVICNAGVIEREYKLTGDGIEMDFQVNYLGINPSFPDDYHGRDDD